MEKVSRDLQALIEDTHLLDNVSGEQMVGWGISAGPGTAGKSVQVSFAIVLHSHTGTCGASNVFVSVLSFE